MPELEIVPSRTDKASLNRFSVLGPPVLPRREGGHYDSGFGLQVPYGTGTVKVKGLAL